MPLTGDEGRSYRWCQLCQAEWTTGGSLSQHLTRVHGEDLLPGCGECGAFYRTRRSDILRHMESQHVILAAAVQSAKLWWGLTPRTPGRGTRRAADVCLDRIWPYCRREEGLVRPDLLQRAIEGARGADAVWLALRQPAIGESPPNKKPRRRRGERDSPSSEEPETVTYGAVTRRVVFARDDEEPGTSCHSADEENFLELSIGFDEFLSVSSEPEGTEIREPRGADAVTQTPSPSTMDAETQTPTPRPDVIWDQDGNMTFELPTGLSTGSFRVSISAGPPSRPMEDARPTQVRR